MQFERKHIYSAVGVVGAIVVVVFVVLKTRDSNTFSKFERCDQTNSTVEEFKVYGCKSVDEDGCKLERGQQAKVRLKFAADKPFKLATTRFTITYHGKEFNSCQSGVSCPSQPLQRQSYEQIVHIPDPLTRLMPHTAIFYLYEISSLEPLVCVQFPVKVYDKVCFVQPERRCTIL